MESVGRTEAHHSGCMSVRSSSSTWGPAKCDNVENMLRREACGLAMLSHHG